MSTLSSIAARVGVSEATVSRVLNDKPGVSETTRLAVLAALDVMGYDRPTKLRETKGRIVGLVIPEITNPIFASISAQISAKLAAEGFAVMQCPIDLADETITEADYLDLLLQHRVSGVILAGGSFHSASAPEDLYSQLQSRSIPTVLLNAIDSPLPFATVSCDDRVATELAWNHLQSLGHERIGLILEGPDQLSSSRRLKTLEALNLAALNTLDPELIRYTDHTIETAQMQAVELITTQNITGLICSSDLIALGAIRAGERRGRAIPTDLSVVGYGDSVLMSHTSPSLTTVRQPVGAMSNTAVRILIQEIAGEFLPNQHYLFDPELVVRNSTSQLRR